MERYRSAAAKLRRPEAATAGNLLNEEERTEVVDWLTAHKWDVAAISAEDLMAGNRRFTPTDLEDQTPQCVFVEGRLR
jgi:O-methyltransferase involved in polyketide biosynthesis